MKMSKDQQSLKSTTKLLSKMDCDRLKAKLARLNSPTDLSSEQVQAKYKVVSNCSNSGKELQVKEELKQGERRRWRKRRSWRYMIRKSIFNLMNPIKFPT